MLAMNTTELLNDRRNTPEVKWICQIMVAEGVVGVLGNLLVCFVILRVKFLHDMTNYLLVNLAVADILLCLEEIFFFLTASSRCTLIAFVPESLGVRTVLCRLLASSFLGWALSYASAYSLCVVTLERFVAIVHPLQYARKLTATRMKMLTVLIWVMSFLFPLSFVFTNDASKDSNNACTGINYPHPVIFPVLVGIFTFLTAYLLPITLMSLAYCKMHKTLKSQVNTLNLQQARPAANDLMTARQRLVEMLRVVLGALIILWTPVYISSLLCLLTPHNAPLPFCNSTAVDNITIVTKFVFYLNSVINPIVYEFKYKKFRKGLRAAFCCCFQKHSNNRVDIQLAPL